MLPFEFVEPPGITQQVIGQLQGIRTKYKVTELP